jgi:hypothetical protein
LICEGEPRSAIRSGDDPAGVDQPSGATAFVSGGNFGSTVFDPMNGEELHIAICDACLSVKAAAGLVIHVVRSVPVSHVVSVQQWSAATTDS